MVSAPVAADQFNGIAHAVGHTPRLEISWQLDFKSFLLDAFVAGVGTGGTVIGVGRELRRQKPSGKFIPARAMRVSDAFGREEGGPPPDPGDRRRDHVGCKPCRRGQAGALEPQSGIGRCSGPQARLPRLLRHLWLRPAYRESLRTLLIRLEIDMPASFFYVFRRNEAPITPQMIFSGNSLYSTSKMVRLRAIARTRRTVRGGGHSLCVNGQPCERLTFVPEELINILVASPVSESALTELQKHHAVTVGVNLPDQEFLTAVAEADALVFRSGVSLSTSVLKAAKRLKLIVRAGSGMDNIDLAYVREKGIVFERIPQPGARAVAELSFAMMLALARNLLFADRMWRGGHWVKYDIEAYLLSRKRLGIVGAGNIGIQVGKLGALWGMDVIGCVETLTPEIAAELAAHKIRPAEFTEVVTTSDFVSIHTPLTAATRGLLCLPCG